ncbi:MAG TPA: helix-turn-helix domain-containing protein, partial [Terriglobales bacterium]|nr:helix-turn-helix domain-containing protein [Terriglobales bacterium]
AEKTLADDALERMMAYDWPGNVRELENSIERAWALSSGPVLHASDLPTTLQGRPPRSPGVGGDHGVVPLEELERKAILEALQRVNGDKLLAARLLGIGKTTLYRKLKEYGVQE